MYIVSIEGADVRFLGGSARTRNDRVAARAGAMPASFHTLATADAAPAVLVPPGTALMLPLFSNDQFLSAVAGTSASRVIAPDGATLVVGPADRLVPLASMPLLVEETPAHRIADGCLLNIATSTARRRATRIALRATQKATDGYVSRTFNRPVSRVFSRMALAVGMSATGASIATLLVGLLCAWIGAQPGYLWFVATGLLFHLASVLDGVDGEIARATLTESERGARVDTIVDQLTYLTCFAGMTIGWAREGSGLVAVWSTGLIGAALLASLARAGRFVAHHAPNASFVWIDRAVRRAAADTRRTPLRAAAALFTLLRRDLFAVIFLGVSLTGQRALVPVLILTGIVIANATLTVYDRELANAVAAIKEDLGLAPHLSATEHAKGTAPGPR